MICEAERREVHAAGEKADDRRFERGVEGEGKIGGAANEGDVKFFGHGAESAADGGKEMSVFVGVGVGG